MKWQPGDTVMLKSGGPPMTVVYGGSDGPASLGDDRTGYACIWFDFDGRYHKEAFREESLVALNEISTAPAYATWQVLKAGGP